MIIGVDAGALSITDVRLRVGVWRVTYNLLKELAKIDKKNEYRLFTFTPIGERFGKNFKNVVVRPKIGWASLQLPIELRRHPVDVFLGLSQMLPHSSARTIGFIYDLGFLHHPEAYPGSQKRLVKITSDLVRRSDHIVTISHAVKDDVRKTYGVGEKRMTVCYPGVDETFTPHLLNGAGFRPRGSTHKGKYPYFLFIGALKPGKNVPGLLRGFARFLESQKKPYDLYLGGGDYWKDPQIQKEIKALVLTSRVKQLGFIPDAKLAGYYRGAVTFVSPSLYEGFCLPAVEAMACGCPVIGSTAGAFPEIVRDSGILVDSGDSLVLANAMRVMATNTKKRSLFIKKGLQNARRFRWKTFAEKTIEIMNRINADSRSQLR